MGVVFLAEQPSLARMVVIKLLQSALAINDALVRQFHTEAVAACRVQGAGAIGIIDYGMCGGAPFIVMEHVPGPLLSAVLAEEEVSIPRALRLVRQLLRTLKTAHARGVIHGDLKSDNIIVERTRDGDSTTLIDFGLARIEDRPDGSVVRSADSVSGTPEYMAPELVRGELPTPASDLYSVGVILYELLTGRRPFEGAIDEVLMGQLQEAPVPPSRRRPDRGISSVLDAIVLRALEKDPRARYATAADLAEALANVLRPLCTVSAPQALPRAA
jgi:serine/threonine-protein kinase